MKQKKGIPLIKLVIIIVAIIVAIELIFLVIFKFNQTEKQDEEGIDITLTSEKENEVISKIENAFNKLREEVIVNVATIDGYQPSNSYIDTDNSEKGNAFDLKNIIISELGENVIDESKDKISDINLDTFKKNEGEFIELNDGYHVYLSNGETQDEKYITIVYVDSSFNHGMAYYDTENNLVVDTTYGTYPILVAQIRLTSNDASYYLEPIKSVNEN